MLCFTTRTLHCLLGEAQSHPSFDIARKHACTCCAARQEALRTEMAETGLYVAGETLCCSQHNRVNAVPGHLCCPTKVDAAQLMSRLACPCFGTKSFRCKAESGSLASSLGKVCVCALCNLGPYVLFSIIANTASEQDCCTTTKHNPARTPNKAFPVLKLYYNQAQSSQDPKRGISSTKVALQSSTIQPGPQTRHFQY